MDILITPRGIGELPASARADSEMETKTEPLRANSFQRMLELEKKYKVCGYPDYAFPGTFVFSLDLIMSQCAAHV